MAFKSTLVIAFIALTALQVAYAKPMLGCFGSCLPGVCSHTSCCSPCISACSYPGCGFNPCGCLSCGGCGGCGGGWC